MLEQAHERQFATTQLGLVSAGFELEHAARVGLALHTLFQHFENHPHHESQRPTSPHTQHLSDLRLCNFSRSPAPLPPFDTTESTTDLPPSPAASASTAHKSGRSPIAITDLINPDPISPRPGKRKYSGSHEAPYVDADSVDTMFDHDNEILYQSALDYMRAIHPHTAKMTRTHREARMRRPSPTRLAFYPYQSQRPYEAQQAEKEASLLLGLSKGCARAMR